MITPYQQCLVCGKIVKINKPILGSLHICASSEEVSQVRNNLYSQPTQYMSKESTELLRSLLKK